MENSKNIIDCIDDNIELLRARYTGGLTFVVGDIHGDYVTLKRLMDKIRFLPDKDHVFFVGDYNAGGNPKKLLEYMAGYYQADYSRPGFHMIRGNHERELFPIYKLENLPDVIVRRGRNIDFFITHAGMVKSVYKLIKEDISSNPGQQCFAYRISKEAGHYNTPGAMKYVFWSRRGLYSQHSELGLWPAEAELLSDHACIIHGHTPYIYLKKSGRFSYGDRNLFWKQQRIFFSEDLQSFDIDSNIKGRFGEADHYRGISCICLEALEDIAEQNDGRLTNDGIRNADNFAFGMRRTRERGNMSFGDIDAVLSAAPSMRVITLDDMREPVLL